MITTTTTIYPGYAVNTLYKIGNPSWHKLVNRLASLPPTEPEALAFTLMMRRQCMLRLGGTENSCSEFGCAVCAKEALVNYRGSERDLLDEYYRTLDEVNGFLSVNLKQIRRAA
jgi:hypothetical protein